MKGKKKISKVVTVIAHTAPKLKQSLFLTLDEPVFLTHISQRG